MRRAIWLGLIGLASITGAHAPALAQSDGSPTVNPGLPAVGELKDNEIAAFAMLQQSGTLKSPLDAQALLARALALVPEPGPRRGMIACAYASKVYEELVLSPAIETPQGQQRVLTASEECHRLLPDFAPAQMLVGMTKVATSQPGPGARLIIAAIKAAPATSRTIDITTMKWIFRQLGYAQEAGLVTELRQALVEAGYGKDDPSFFGGMAVEVMAAHIAANANSEAVALLPQVLDPELGLQLLIDQRFKAIWPMIEQWAGGDLVRQRDAQITAARAAFRVDPNLANRRLLAEALWQGGKRAEATDLLGAAVNDPKLWDDDRFHIGLMTGRYAKMLIVQGRGDEAIAAAHRVNQANPVAKYPLAANLMPNFARLLIQLDRSEEALTLIAAQMPTVLETDAAFGFYAALRFCAFHRLGKEREASEQSALLDTRFAANAGATGIKSSCAVDAAGARRYWVERLMDSGSRGSALVALTRARLGIQTLDSPDAFGAEELSRSVPQLRAAFESFGRELPASYLPALRMWEAPPAPAAAPPPRREQWPPAETQPRRP